MSSQAAASAWRSLARSPLAYGPFSSGSSSTSRKREAHARPCATRLAELQGMLDRLAATGALSAEQRAAFENPERERIAGEEGGSAMELLALLALTRAPMTQGDLAAVLRHAPAEMERLFAATQG